MVKGIIKYGLYFFAGLWIFILGVMVGRGNPPFSFDTRGFQARLETIAKASGSRAPAGEKMDLKFYDALNNPVRHEVKGRPEKSGEIIPSTEKPMPVRPRAADQAILVKLSRKKATLNRGAGSGQAFQEQIKSKKTPVKTGIKPVKKPIVSKKSPLPEKSSQPLKTAQKEDPRAVEARKTQSKGGYTIQVAAYKAFKDAVTHMAALEKKGVASYRVRGKKDGKTWYRVRTGAFADYDTAAARLKELKQAKIDGMIIKKEER